MQWPFKTRHAACDARVFQNPKTGKLTLLLQGDVGLPPGWEEPIVSLNVRLEALLSDEAAVQLRDQLIALLPHVSGDDRPA